MVPGTVPGLEAGRDAPPTRGLSRVGAGVPLASTGSQRRAQRQLTSEGSESKYLGTGARPTPASQSAPGGKPRSGPRGASAPTATAAPGGSALPSPTHGAGAVRALAGLPQLHRSQDRSGPAGVAGMPITSVCGEKDDRQKDARSPEPPRRRPQWRCPHPRLQAGSEMPLRDSSEEEPSQRHTSSGTLIPESDS
ncbi:translation initiation factor IF-2-like [Prionailurus viverrinus]|uniref:translation initiation factor IF-2-like n=1 Tax=Prionailurus viverrinus TaxID=61388 RepID=UPI001FF2532F|nr:translation initiation factor IF-2-like [Prionailurus viverrinus]